MSENIQSISQGTYTIGQTSATNFQAGPGISITQPSEGTVRIGNDETVLWENSAGVQLKNGITLSESRLNFDKLEVYYKNNTNAETEVGIYYWPQYGHNTGNRFRWNLDTPFQDLSTTAGGFMLRWDVLGSASETHIQSEHAYWLGVVGMTGQNTPTINGGENTSIPVVYKVIGINRINA